MLTNPALGDSMEAMIFNLIRSGKREIRIGTSPHCDIRIHHPDGLQTLDFLLRVHPEDSAWGEYSIQYCNPNPSLPLYVVSNAAISAQCNSRNEKILN